MEWYKTLGLTKEGGHSLPRTEGTRGESGLQESEVGWKGKTKGSCGFYRRVQSSFRYFIGKQLEKSTPLAHSPPALWAPASILHWLNPTEKDPFIGVEVNFLGHKAGCRRVERQMEGILHRLQAVFIQPHLYHSCVSVPSTWIISSLCFIMSFALVFVFFFPPKAQAPRSPWDFVPADLHA